MRFIAPPSRRGARRRGPPRPRRRRAAHELFDHPAPPAAGGQPGPTHGGRQHGRRAAPSGSSSAASPPATRTPTSTSSPATANTYASVGHARRRARTAAGRPSSSSPSGDEVAPAVRRPAPTASCVANEAAALGLQHDVEASPKGGPILNTFNPFAPQRDAQIIVDATDAKGRCHDHGASAASAARARQRQAGGLEIIDVTDPANPVEIGLTSHIGESHTVNIDPKRPHIAYSVTSDSVGHQRRRHERANEAERLRRSTASRSSTCRRA